MTLATKMQARASTIRARLWRPPNAVPDRGINIGGAAIKAALAENVKRKITEGLQFIEAARIDRLIKKGKAK